ncbi:TPA: outer membrane usher protein [Salmonella enterica subsp. enterica serovar Ball]|uniref:outer membrane usher protein n=1 Tax=Salmonella enterica TaxID=28901 RepID=UPI0010786627|nr:outer membrane usher protein [Salmonella enterica]EAB9748576.1 outer membrane usher protein [Salmonella enterica subsp. salamae]HCA3434286.1 outer membrane usher protein [Salmonella enterica subsp. enterica serovar Ball]EAO6407175.1 outer membrane usher protein [Salmonella enterica]EJF4690728.1 outer membrane usher protein [Salmonella enterica]EJF5294553.1 outer membrane usher protein [Salmonella enterica]
MVQYRFFRLKILAAIVGCLLISAPENSYAEDAIQFNTDFLDVKDGASLDLNRFSRKNYVMPGKYTLQVMVNGSQILQERTLEYSALLAGDEDTYPCLPPDVVALLGLKPEFAAQLRWTKAEQCLLPGQIEGLEMQTTLSNSTLTVVIPQAYLQYVDQDWEPPSRWDEGIPGVIFDYNVNSQWRHPEHNEGDEYDISGNGTVGANLGPWRLRADWQASYVHHQANDSGDEVYDNSASTQRQWDWNRYYAWRAIPALQAQLMLGESTLESDVFDSFNYVGASLITDDQMLPPNLRGYAPDITGVARSNAKVTVTQKGRVVHESQVPAGPFRIQGLSDSISGDLHVRIEEQNGQVQEYDVSTASIPFLTRPGQIRYKATTGRPQTWDHKMEGDFFSVGELSWGVADGWSLYGGGTGSQDYQSLAIGVGRDMAALGALSFDLTHSRANLPEGSDYGEGVTNGNSFRASFSKDFDDLDSRLTFAGYRFSEDNFITMDEFIDADRESGSGRSGHDKAMYTLTYSQNFVNINVNAYINLTHRSYWNRASEDSYNLSVSHFFDLGDVRSISLTLNGFRNEYDNNTDDGVYVSLSIPWGSDRTLSYNGSWGGSNSNQVGYYERIDERNNYQVNVGRGSGKEMANGYYRYQSSLADIDVSANYQEGDSVSGGLSMQGGATLTAHGGALHRVGVVGGSRLLVDVGDESGIPVSSYGSPVYTNIFGKAVLIDVNDYDRNQVKIDITHLPDNAEAMSSVTQATLTEGAIGYRRMEVLTGQKAVATLRLADGEAPPFGAEVKNSHQQTIGMLDDSGNVYLIGVNAGDRFQVYWDGEPQCEIALPTPLPGDLFHGLLLPCHSESAPVVAPAPSIQPMLQQHTQRVTPSDVPESLSGAPSSSHSIR